MRIAFIAPFGLQPKGTVSARMVPLAHALARRGHTVRIVIPPWDDPTAVHLHKPVHETTAANNGIIDLVTLPLPRRVPNTIGLTAGLIKEGALSFRPDVVHVFKPVGYSGLSAFVLKAMGVPWVLDTDDWEGPGGWADVNPYSRAEKAAVTIQEALLPRVAGAVTAASRTLEARAWTFGRPRNRVFYLPNGVSSPERFSVQPERISTLKRLLGIEHRPVLLLYTRFAEFPWLWALDVLEQVVAERPHIALVVVGSGFFGEERDLKTEATRRGLEENLLVVGRIPEPEIPDYLSAGDVLIYPLQDTVLNRAKSPVKLLEPMAAGLPIVAHRVGQAPEFLDGTGILVEPGNLEDMARTVLALLDNTDRRKLLGGMAQTRVRECFNWDLLARVAESSYRVATGR